MIFFLPYSNLLWTKLLSLYQRQKHVFSAFGLLDTHVFDPKMLQGVKKNTHTHNGFPGRPKVFYFPGDLGKKEMPQ